MEQTATIAERVSAQVAALIKDSGVTVVWLCGKTGIPRSTMLRRLDGHQPFNLNELDRIAEALRFTVDITISNSLTPSAPSAPSADAAAS